MDAVFDHVSLTVADLRRSIAFYEKHFGFSPARQDGPKRGPNVDALTGLKESQVDAAFVTNGALTLEFLEFVSPKGRPSSTPMNDVGSPHLGFIVKDVRAEFERLRAEGVDLVGPVVTSPNRGASIMLRDPDGICIELREGPAIPK